MTRRVSLRPPRQILELQTRVEQLSVWSEALGRNITLRDICFAPLAPDNRNCTIQVRGDERSIILQSIIGCYFLYPFQLVGGVHKLNEIN